MYYACYIAYSKLPVAVVTDGVFIAGDGMLDAFCIHYSNLLAAFDTFADIVDNFVCADYNNNFFRSECYAAGSVSGAVHINKLAVFCDCI